MLTSFFVLYFILDCSRVYVDMYRTNRKQLRDSEAEHERTVIALGAKSEFLATISHELRTPLTSIKGALDLINARSFGPLPEKYLKVFGIAQKNADRLTSLINELLDLQRMELGKWRTKCKPWMWRSWYCSA